MRTARQGRQPETVQVFALIANHGEHPRDVYVTVRREGDADVVASRRLRVDPGAREPVILSFPLAPGDVGRGVVLDLDPHDALATDDVAYGRIPPGAQLPVVLVMRGESPWVQRALESDPDVRLTPLPADQLATAPPGALLVLHGLCPDPLPAGHDVLVFAPPAGRCSDVTVGASVEAPSITSYQHTDARFRFLTMDGVHIADGTPLQLGSHSSEILHAGDAALFADASTPEREVTIVGLDPSDSDWPLRASFVLFIRNVEEIARAHRARAVMGGGRTGDPLRVAVPPGVTRVDVDGPSGTEHVGVTAGSAVVGETSRAGLYHLRWRGGDTIAAVNLLSDAESNLRVAPLRVEGSQPIADVHALVRPHEELTPWVALAAALILAFNLFWITRRERTPTTPARAVRPLGGAS
jgi:hypothetical protein